jgi:hypothetical protein
MLNRDLPHRLFRLMEVLADSELKRRRTGPGHLDGWLMLAEQRSPGSPKGVSEGDYPVTLPDGSLFQEWMFRAEQVPVADALPDWAASAERRWAYYEDGVVHVSDGTCFPESEVQVAWVD